MPAPCCHAHPASPHLNRQPLTLRVCCCCALRPSSLPSLPIPPIHANLSHSSHYVASEAAATVQRGKQAAHPSSKPKGRRPGSAAAGPSHAAADIDALPSHQRARKGAAKAKARAAAAEGDELDAEYRRAEAMRSSNLALLAEMRLWEEQDQEAEDAAAAGVVSRAGSVTCSVVVGFAGSERREGCSSCSAPLYSKAPAHHACPFSLASTMVCMCWRGCMWPVAACCLLI